MRSSVFVLSLVPLVAGLSTPFGSTSKNVATQVLQGTGPVAVDLNEYNLPADEIEREWSAQLVQKVNENEVNAKLCARSDKENYVDTVNILFPRRKDAGLGIELVELAGGRADGLGITLVSGLVEGGSAEGTDIRVGDSIAEVAVVRQLQSGSGGIVEETQEEFSIATECLSYEETVNEILSLPAASSQFDEYFRLKLKRLRRVPKVCVNLQFPPSENKEDVSLELFAGENLRYGMLVRGVKLNDPLAKRFDTKSSGNCGAGGLCRTCAVVVQNGADLLNPQRAAEKTMLADNPRWRLACKAIVGYGMQEGSMIVRVNPSQW